MWDEFTFEIKELSLFKTKRNFKQLKKESFDGGQPKITKVIPPQIVDKETAQTISDSAAKA